MKEFTIGKTKIGGNNQVFIIAEIGINFDGKYEQALELIDVAAKAGCNAVKFQLFTAKRMYPPNAGKYKIASGKLKDIFQIVKGGELPPVWIPKLITYANKRGVEWFSSACDEVSTNILEKYKVGAYKVPSYEITHLPLFRHIARKKKPIIFSSGGATLKEVSEVMEVLEKEGCSDILLNHCQGQYPPSIETLNLNVLTMFQLAFPHAVIGFSDNGSDPSLGVARAVVALGAKAYEAHITLDRNLPGPDHSFALNPNELAKTVKTIRETEQELRVRKQIEIDQKLLGASERKPYEGERYVREFAYRCVFTTKSIKKGEKFTKNNIAVLRPGKQKRGLEPKYYELFIKGYRATRPIAAYKSIRWDDILLR